MHRTQYISGLDLKRASAPQVCTGALQQGRGRANKPWAGVEAAMSLRLNHGSVVRTFKHTVVLLQARHGATLRSET